MQRDITGTALGTVNRIACTFTRQISRSVACRPDVTCLVAIAGTGTAHIEAADCIYFIVSILAMRLEGLFAGRVQAVLS